MHRFGYEQLLVLLYNYNKFMLDLENVIEIYTRHFTMLQVLMLKYFDKFRINVNFMELIENFFQSWVAVFRPFSWRSQTWHRICWSKEPPTTWPTRQEKESQEMQWTRLASTLTTVSVNGRPQSFPLISLVTWHTLIFFSSLSFLNFCINFQLVG